MLPLRGRVALVTGASRRAGIGYATARRLAALGASLFLHHYVPHDRDQPWGADPDGTQAVVAGVTGALAADGASVRDMELDLAGPGAPARDIWRPSDLLAAFRPVGFEPSLSKVSALWSGKPVSVRLDDLDKICAALGCTVADLLEAEPLADTAPEVRYSDSGV